MTAQAQLLDRRTLLLSTGLRNPTRTKSSSVGFPTFPTACKVLSPHPLLEPWVIRSTGASLARHTCGLQAYFLVAYDWQSGQVLSFMDSQSEDMLMLYLRLTPWFHDGHMSSLWARHVTPCPIAYWCPGEQSTLRRYVSQQVALLPRLLCSSSDYALAL